MWLQTACPGGWEFFAFLQCEEWLNDYQWCWVHLLDPWAPWSSLAVSSSAFPWGLVGFPFSWSAWHKHWQHHISFSCLHTS